MARIVVITHEYDHFHAQPYFLKLILPHIASRGHEVIVTAGTDQFVEADLAILHVDLTITPPEYLDLAGRYPRTVNLAVSDISKPKVSQAALRPGDRWDGPVIVKSRLNAHGGPERNHNQRAAALGRPLPYPDLKPVGRYRIFEKFADIPQQIHARDDLCIEKFLCDHDGQGYRVYLWSFFGSRGAANFRRGSNPLVKGLDVRVVKDVEVPEELRAERKRLGYDFGKFDYVMHEGRAVLIDANKTSGVPTDNIRRMSVFAAEYAPGIDALLEDT